jgi:hypothetical protein
LHPEKTATQLNKEQPTQNAQVVGGEDAHPVDL